jgi:antitoxin (DNA-binding transcriptional repressor) of toxin-antitoxin stability system
MYNGGMDLTISRFRRDLFNLVEAAARGEEIMFTHKGIHFRVTPEIAADRLSRLTPMQVVTPHTAGLDRKDLMEEMQRAWEKDWVSL